MGELIAAAPEADATLVARLRAGDQAAFAEVVQAWTPAMLHVARSFVGSQASAEEAVQETWVAVLRGLDGFQGRSLLRTWVFSILANTARRQAERDGRQVPWSHADDDGIGPTVDPGRFRGPGEQWAGGWTAEGAPSAWHPEVMALSAEVSAVLARALDDLPPRQRAVVGLRDVHGFTADEVCAALDLSPANQRVLLHRGRAQLRRVLEDWHCEGRVKP